MATARILHTATLLPGGKVLVVGGLTACNPLCTPTNTAEIYDPATGIWRGTARMRLPRANHAAVSLRNGKVLVAGGYLGMGEVTRESELYDPETETWSATGPLSEARQFLVGTLLSDGKVLMTGGYRAGATFDLVELYDPELARWSQVGNMTAPRVLHTATLLSNGKVLVTGGGSALALPTTESYNSVDQSWALSGQLTVARVDHTATSLPNGKVLILGGRPAENEIAFDQAELFDPTPGNGALLPRSFRDYATDL